MKDEQIKKHAWAFMLFLDLLSSFLSLNYPGQSEPYHLESHIYERLDHLLLVGYDLPNSEISIKIWKLRITTTPDARYRRQFQREKRAF